MKSPTLAVAASLFVSSLLVSSLVVPSAAACEMHNKSTSTAVMVDPIKTASMEMAAPVSAGDLTIEGYWVKAMLPGQPVAGGYFSVSNSGAVDDMLLSASSAKSGRMELHEMAMTGDVMQMREVKGGIIVPAGGKVELAPGGLHIMFFEVSDSFKEGDMVPVTLTFEKAGKIDLMIPVIAKAMKH